LAHRVIPLRCGIWPVSAHSGIDQAEPIKLHL
jgi:hypothetical protein